MNLHGCINGIGRWIRSQWKIFLALFVVLGCVFSASMMSSAPIRAESDVGDFVDTDGDGSTNTSDTNPAGENKPEEEKGVHPLEDMLISIYSAKITMFGIPIDFGNLPKSIDSFIDFNQMQDLSAGGTVTNSDGAEGKQSREGGINLFNFFRNTIFPIAQGLGTTLLTLMLLWKYIKECLEVERFTWERALMIFARCFIVNMFIAGSFDILCYFAEAAGNLMNAIQFAEPQVTSIGQALADAVTNTGDWLQKMAVFVVGIMLAFAYYGTAIAVVVQVLIRVVKIMVAMAFSPIPIALSMDEQHGTDVLRYCFWAFGLFLQAPIIKVSTWIYSQVLTEVASSSTEGLAAVIPVAIGICVCNGLLAGLISMGQQVTDRIIPA